MTDITRQYIKRFLSESQKKNEAQREMCLLPTYKETIESIGYAACDAKELDGAASEYKSKCIPIKVTTDLNASFNAIVVGTVPDTFNAESEYANDLYIDEIVIPVNNIAESFSMYGDDFDASAGMSAKEFQTKLQEGGNTLTKEKLDLLSEVLVDEQDLGSFEGVTTITKTPKVLTDADSEDDSENTAELVPSSIQKLVQTALQNKNCWFQQIEILQNAQNPKFQVLRAVFHPEENWKSFDRKSSLIEKTIKNLSVVGGVDSMNEIKDATSIEFTLEFILK